MKQTETILLPYGNEVKRLIIPRSNLMGVFSPRDVEIAESETTLIADALCNPIGTPRLRDMVQPGMHVAIIADDITRPTPVHKILPLILDELNTGGVPDQDICVVFALGTHEPMSTAQMRQRAGRVAERVGLFNSEFRDPEGMVDCGRAPDGVRVSVDRRVAEADFRVGIGSIMPHPECGWGGGGKIIYPGVAGEETVTTFHLSYGRVDWNSYGSDHAPVRLNMEKWVDTVGLDFIVNSVMTPEDRVYRMVAGHYVEAHRKGTAYGREIYSVVLPERADIVVITSFRADEDFWLASKAIFAGELVVKDGGTLILLSPCPEGVGPHPEYADYIGRDDWDVLLEDAFGGKLRQPIAASAAVALARMRSRFSVSIVSHGLTGAEVKRMQYRHFPTVEEAIAEAKERLGTDAKVAVLPYGISTLPEVRGSATG